MLKLLGIRSLISFNWCALSTNYVYWTKQNPFAAPYFTFNTRLVLVAIKRYDKIHSIYIFLYEMGLKRVPLVFRLSRDHSLSILTTKVDVQMDWKLLPRILRDEHQICLALLRVEKNRLLSHLWINMKTILIILHSLIFIAILFVPHYIFQIYNRSLKRNTITLIYIKYNNNYFE